MSGKDSILCLKTELDAIWQMQTDPRNPSQLLPLGPSPIRQTTLAPCRWVPSQWHSPDCSADMVGRSNAPGQSSMLVSQASKRHWFCVSSWQGTHFEALQGSLWTTSPLDLGELDHSISKAQHSFPKITIPQISLLYCKIFLLLFFWLKDLSRTNFIGMWPVRQAPTLGKALRLI